MPWEEGQDVTFEHALIEDLDNYKIDEHLYKEIPTPEHVSSREGQITIEAIRKSDKLAIRQAARIAHFIKIFNRNSGRLSILMILIIFLQLVILVLQLVR